MAEIRTGRAGEPSVWSTRDLMVNAAIGVALGVVLVPVIYATMALPGALGAARDREGRASIGVAWRVVLVPVIYATMALHAALGPLGMASIWGLYVVPLLVATRVMRRPGAALLTRLVVSAAALPVRS